MSYRYRSGTYRARSTVARQMTARFPGTCRVCGGQVRPGDTIEWIASSRTVMHAACTGDTAPADRALAAYVAEGLGEDDGGADRRQRARDDADYAAGLAAGRRYSEDRKMFGDDLANAWAMDREMWEYNNGIE